MITKERFVRAMDALKAQYMYDKRKAQLLSEYLDDYETDHYCNSIIESELIEQLCEQIPLPYEISFGLIEFGLWGTNYLTNNDLHVFIDNKQCDVNSYDDLYVVIEKLVEREKIF